MKYIMESQDEAQRLLVQERSGNAREALRRAGLAVGHRVLDAGCGPGGITDIIAEEVGPSGHVTGIDLSEERLSEARRVNARHAHVHLRPGDVRDTRLPDASFDFVWSQFVLQYMRDRRAALQELVRVTRPGGRVVIAEYDGFGMNNWPFPEPLRLWSQNFVDAVRQKTGVDIHVGRKVFTELRALGLAPVKVHLLPQYVIAGEADEELYRDWETRFGALESLVAPDLGGVEAYRAMCQEYLQLLVNPDALKYSVLLVTEATRP